MWLFASIEIKDQNIQFLNNSHLGLPQPPKIFEPEMGQDKLPGFPAQTNDINFLVTN